MKDMVDVFELTNQLIGDYRRYVASFIAMRGRCIRERVQSSLDEGRLWHRRTMGMGVGVSDRKVKTAAFAHYT